MVRGSWISSLELSDVTVEGVDGPLLRLWNADLSPTVVQNRVEGVNDRIEKAQGPFKVKGI